MTQKLEGKVRVAVIPVRVDSEVGEDIFGIIKRLTQTEDVTALTCTKSYFMKSCASEHHDRTPVRRRPEG